MIYYLLFALLAIREGLHFIERRELYDRIMSRDIHDYKSRDKPVKNAESAHERVLRKWRKPTAERSDNA